jgi:hypothetical protein
MSQDAAARATDDAPATDEAPTPDEAPEPEEARVPEAAPSADDTEAADDVPAGGQSSAGEVQTVDLVRDELTLARAQLDAGLSALAEGTARRRIAAREADGPAADEEVDALRVLLAEALWRQGRIAGARAALDAIRPGSNRRKLPIATLIEAESLAAAGETDRAAGAQERVIAAVGVDDAFALRGGVTGRLTWPLPVELVPGPRRAPRAPWASEVGDEGPMAPGEDARVAAGRGRLEEARTAYVAGDLERGDGEMGIAIRLDPALAADGVAIMEPTLGGQPGAERLLLYGDLLRAAGRHAEADGFYDRAADRGG